MNPRCQALFTPQATNDCIDKTGGTRSIGSRQAGNGRVAWLIQRGGVSLHQESSISPPRLQPALRTSIRHESPLSSAFHPPSHKRLHRQNGRGPALSEAGRPVTEWLPGLIQSVGRSLHQESSCLPTHLQPALRISIRHEDQLSSAFHPPSHKRLHRQNGRGPALSEAGRPVMEEWPSLIQRVGISLH